MLHLEKGKTYNRQRVLHQIVDMQYERNDIDFSRGKFRIRGDTWKSCRPTKKSDCASSFSGMKWSVSCRLTRLPANY